MYTPDPIDTKDVALDPEIRALGEMLSENTHEVWAKKRMDEGWTWGTERDDEKKTHPCLVPYDQLPERERDYDRATSMETLKLIIKLGYKIEKAT